MSKTKQRLLTIPLGRPMRTFIEQQTAGSRVVAISPHYNTAAMLMGYLVVVEEDESAQAADGVARPDGISNV